MVLYKISERNIQRFAQYLREADYACGSVEKYVRDVCAFAVWLEGSAITKEALVYWKEHLLTKYQPRTINSMFAALNCFFSFMNWKFFHIKYLRIQRRLFRSEDRELSKQNYNNLLNAAKQTGRTRLALLMETICALGIRVSEVQYITVEAIQAGRTDIALKGKIRTILIPGKLCKKLRKYAEKQKTVSGEIFLTRNGKGISRRQIWAEMKALCIKAGVASTKVFPHNLRHLFARTFYWAYKDVVKLADVLGHTSIETTRIYLVSTELEHVQQMEQLWLIS